MILFAPSITVGARESRLDLSMKLACARSSCLRTTSCSSMISMTKQKSWESLARCVLFDAMASTQAQRRTDCLGRDRGQSSGSTAWRRGLVQLKRSMTLRMTTRTPWRCAVSMTICERLGSERLEEVAFQRVVVRHRDYVNTTNLQKVSVLALSDCEDLRRHYGTMLRCCALTRSVGRAQPGAATTLRHARRGQSALRLGQIPAGASEADHLTSLRRGLSDSAAELAGCESHRSWG
jgi:hypothetical protein